MALFALLINKILFVTILKLDPIYEYALLTMFVLPPPFVITVFMGKDHPQDQQYVVGTLSLSTVVSIGVFLLATIFYS